MIHFLLEAIEIICKVFACILIADFFTGAIHWFEDAYGNPNWLILGKVIQDNILHHNKPEEFLKGTFFDRIKVSLVIAILLFSVFLYFGIINYYIAFTLVYSSLANQLHAISHTPPPEISS